MAPGRQHHVEDDDRQAGLLSVQASFCGHAASFCKMAIDEDEVQLLRPELVREVDRLISLGGLGGNHEGFMLVEQATQATSQQRVWVRNQNAHRPVRSVHDYGSSFPPRMKNGDPTGQKRPVGSPHELRSAHRKPRSTVYVEPSSSLTPMRQ